MADIHEYHQASIHADLGPNRAQLLYGHLCGMGMGARSLPKTFDVDSFSVVVQVHDRLGRPAVVGDGVVRHSVDSCFCRIPPVPKRDPSGHHSSPNEVSGRTCLSKTAIEVELLPTRVQSTLAACTEAEPGRNPCIDRNSASS